MDSDFDDDLYGNLAEVADGHAAQLKVIDLQNNVDSLTETIEILKTKNKQLSIENRILKRNLQSLLKTAQAEIKRKDKEIDRHTKQNIRQSDKPSCSLLEAEVTDLMCCEPTVTQNSDKFSENVSDRLKRLAGMPSISEKIDCRQGRRSHEDRLEEKGRDYHYRERRSTSKKSLDRPGRHDRSRTPPNHRFNNRRRSAYRSPPGREIGQRDRSRSTGRDRQRRYRSRRERYRRDFDRRKFNSRSISPSPPYSKGIHKSQEPTSYSEVGKIPKQCKEKNPEPISPSPPPASTAITHPVSNSDVTCSDNKEITEVELTSTRCSDKDTLERRNIDEENGELAAAIKSNNLFPKHYMEISKEEGERSDSDSFEDALEVAPNTDWKQSFKNKRGSEASVKTLFTIRMEEKLRREAALSQDAEESKIIASNSLIQDAQPQICENIESTFEKTENTQNHSVDMQEEKEDGEIDDSTVDEVMLNNDETKRTVANTSPTLNTCYQLLALSPIKKCMSLFQFHLGKKESTDAINSTNATVDVREEIEEGIDGLLTNQVPIIQKISSEFTIEKPQNPLRPSDIFTDVSDLNNTEKPQTSKSLSTIESNGASENVEGTNLNTNLKENQAFDLFRYKIPKKKSSELENKEKHLSMETREERDMKKDRKESNMNRQQKKCPQRNIPTLKTSVKSSSDGNSKISSLPNSATQNHVPIIKKSSKACSETNKTRFRTRINEDKNSINVKESSCAVGKQSGKPVHKPKETKNETDRQYEAKILPTSCNSRNTKIVSRSCGIKTAGGNEESSEEVNEFVKAKESGGSVINDVPLVDPRVMNLLQIVESASEITNSSPNDSDVITLQGIVDSTPAVPTESTHINQLESTDSSTQSCEQTSTNIENFKIFKSISSDPNSTEGTPLKKDLSLSDSESEDAASSSLSSSEYDSDASANVNKWF